MLSRSLAHLSLHRRDELVMWKVVVDPNVLDAAGICRCGTVARERRDIEVAVCNERIHHVSSDVVTTGAKDHDILESRHGCSAVSNAAMW